MRTLRIWLGLVGAPLAWLAQMTLSNVVSSYACYPHQAPLTTPLWDHLRLMVIAVNAGCFAFSLFACLTTVREWRETKKRAGGNGEEVLEIGESRAAFVVMMSALSGFIFTISIVFTGCAILLVSPCKPWF